MQFKNFSILCTFLLSLISFISIGQNQSLNQFNGFIGLWDHEAVEIRPDGSRNEELGSMVATWFLESTYLKSDCVLTGDNYTRYYTQCTGFDASTKIFRSTYL